MNLQQANEHAVERMIAAKPVLVGLAKAVEAIPGMQPDMLLHAGPPIEWAQASGPLRGAITGALIFEGRASDQAEAAELLISGQIQLDPCHHHQAAGPMAGVISPSMSVYVIENQTHGNRAYSNLNEGYGKVLRYGAYSQQVIDKLRWMEEEMAPVLARALESSDGLDLRDLLSQSLHMGDEGHNRNKAGSALYTQWLAPYVAEAAQRPAQAAAILSFLAGNALSVLNPVMAACKAMADAAHGVEGSSLVTVMARNGTEFGIRLSGLGDQWFTAPVAVPQGKYFAGFAADDASGDIGDSTITETAGIGGFAMASAPAIVDFISGKPEDTINATLEMYQICLAEHEHFTMPPLDFRGTPTGIDALRVVTAGITPRINTGIAHKDPGVGQIGAGLVRPPMQIFEHAAAAHQKRYGSS
jgi:hypothetical protein